jgi:sulfur-carrier protein
MSKSIVVQYFAVLREQAGCGEERVETSAASASELYAELAARHGFSLPQRLLKVAVNDDFALWGQALVEGDRVVFIPPVAGG